MSTLLYILELNLYLTGFCLLYKLFLEKEAFFNVNRWLLLSTVLAAFFIPFFKLENLQDSHQLNQSVYMIYEVVVYASSKPIGFWDSFSILDLFTAFYLMGILVTSLLFVQRILFIRKKIQSTPKIIHTDYTELVIPFEESSYSFLSYLFVPKDCNTCIYKHELAHIQLKHTYDVLFMEAVQIICWFNPAIYLLKHALKTIHEYQADQLASNQTNAFTYMETLVYSALGAQQHPLTHSFFNPIILKNRIMMLSKKNVPAWRLVKYTFVLPVLGAMIFLSSTAFVIKKEIKKVEKKATVLLNAAVKDVILIEAPGKTETKVPVLEQQPVISTTKIKEPKSKTKILVNSKIIQTNEIEETDTIYNKVDQNPEFPGGIGRFIAKNLRYPPLARLKATEGRVTITFIVAKDGTIKDPQILRGIGNGCDEEAIRIVQSMPNWAPGKQNGKPVNVRFALPIMFRLESDHLEPENKTSEVVVTAYSSFPQNPLYVIDGIMQADNSKINSLNTLDIESITVLKGGSAISKYGEKAKDGAIIITTKKK